MNNKREKVYYIVMIIFFALSPFALFFDCYEKRSKQTIDGVVSQVVSKYSIININNVSTFSLVVSILFMVFSLAFAVFLAIDLYKGKYYRRHIKILSGINLVLFSGLIFYLSILLGTIFFMIVCCNLFILSFDYKITRKKKENLLIYIPTYILFIFMIIISFGFNTYA